MKSLSARKLTVLLTVAVASLILFAGAAFASGDYLIQADIVRGGEGVPKGPVCVPNSVFLHGEATVFRVKVYDADGGAYIDPAAAEERGVKVEVQLGDLTLPTHMGPHPPGAPNQDFYWTTHWVIPNDYPAGVVNWSIKVTDASGRTGTFEPIGQNIGIPALMIMPPAPGGGAQG